MLKPFFFKTINFAIVLFILFSKLQSQPYNQNKLATKSTTGVLYGRILDASKKGIEYASIQVFQTKFDSISNSEKKIFIGGQLTGSNGDFRVENLPLKSTLSIRISAISYTTKELNETLTPATAEKDIGDVKLETSSKELKEVIIDGSDPSYKLDIDKKVFNVSKNPISDGGTAEDVLKSVPSVNVDTEGKVTLRNASPEIFVDGKPTFLTLDQIPADIIESVEVITNPSAKYDAAGGMAGILNIVLKKNRSIGYNGSLRAGVDMRGRINTGLDLNLREKKLNFFINSNFNQRRSIGTTKTDRNNLTLPLTTIYQDGKFSSNGFFLSAKAGVDYFINNRNTITLSSHLIRGQFKNIDEIFIITDSVPSGNSSNSYRYADANRNFYNSTNSILYKKLFPKQGKEISADISYGFNRNRNDNSFKNQFLSPSNSVFETLQQQKGKGANQIITSQVDFVNPITEKSKMEAGAKLIMREFSSLNENYIYDAANNIYLKIDNISNNYIFLDQVYAAYTTYTNSFHKVGYQLGLRAESSTYSGKIIETEQTFKNLYPVSLFPSAFISYNKNDQNSFQLNFTRRINRPGFFQLIPFTDYADSLNLKRGNAGLKPEFTNSSELSYQKNMNKNNYFIASAYLKNATDLITSYQFIEYDSTLQKEVLINSFQNANASYAYGLELTSKSLVQKFIDLTLNLNLYNSIIDGGNIQENLRNEQFTWFGKINMNTLLPHNFSIQITADYTSKSSIPISGKEQDRSPRTSWFGNPPSTIQGYVNPNYGVDVAIKKVFLKDKSATITLSVSDIFKTREVNEFSKSDFFVQQRIKIRDQQLFRINFSYRFGKADASLFKRKNTQSSIEGVDGGM